MLLFNSEGEIVTCFVTRVRTVNGLDCFPVKVPITNRFSYRLAIKLRRIWCKPSVLSLGLAVGEAWVYEQTVVSRGRESLYSIHHLTPEVYILNLQELTIMIDTLGDVSQRKSPWKKWIWDELQWEWSDLHAFQEPVLSADGGAKLSCTWWCIQLLLFHENE